jgi:hypothetical protein
MLVSLPNIRPVHIGLEVCCWIASAALFDCHDLYKSSLTSSAARAAREKSVVITQSHVKSVLIAIIQSSAFMSLYQNELI